MSEMKRLLERCMEAGHIDESLDCTRGTPCFDEHTICPVYAEVARERWERDLRVLKELCGS